MIQVIIKLVWNLEKAEQWYMHMYLMGGVCYCWVTYIDIGQMLERLLEVISVLYQLINALIPWGLNLKKNNS